MRRLATALVALAALLVPLAGPASAADDVDLETSLLNLVERPVSDSPVQVMALVHNEGSTAATGVVVEVPVPGDADVLFVSNGCSAVADLVTCTFPTLPAGDAVGGNLYLTFGSNGTRPVTASARADQLDADGDSDSSIDVAVEDEDADLTGGAESTRVVLGSAPTARVFHGFDNRGPTAVGGATLSGTLTGGGTIDAASFNFFRDFYGPAGNVAGEHCTVSSSAFTCTGVFSAGGFYAPQPFVFYDVTLPDEPATVVSTATITGRGDPDHSNDTSTYTIEVDEPAAEIYTQLGTPFTPVPSGEPYVVDGPVLNAGELDAHDLVAVLEAPADWDLDVAPVALPAGVACSLVTVPRSVRCTRDVLPSGEWWQVGALVTPPAGSGSGEVHLSVTTTSPESGTLPNEATATIPFAPPRAVEVSPSSGLADGDVVTFRGNGFNPEATIYYCQGIIAGPPDAGDCGVPYETTIADATGAFSVTIAVERFQVVGDVGVVDCAQPGAACGLGAADLDTPGGAAVNTPVTFTLQPPVDDPFGARVTGTVVDPDGQPVAGAAVWAYRPGDHWVGSLRTTTDASGTYVLEDAEPGIGYRIRVAAPGTGLVAEWYGGPGSDGVQSRAEALEVRLTATVPAAEADVELAAGGALVGTLEGPGSAPVAGATVWAYRDQDRWAGTYATTTGADGSYRIENVEPGIDLRVRFVPEAGSGLAPEWFEDAALRRDATVVRVGAGVTTEVDAQLDGS